MGSVLTLQVRLASVKCDVSVLKIIHPAAAQKTKHTHNTHTTTDMSDMQQATIFNHDRGHTRSCFMTKL